MSIERGTLAANFKVGEDWTELLTFRFDGEPAVWTGCRAKLTCRYGEGETAEEAFTLDSAAPTADGSITFGANGLMTVALSRTKSLTLRPAELVGDLLVIDAASRSLYYLDVFLTVSPRSTVR